LSFLKKTCQFHHQAMNSTSQFDEFHGVSTNICTQYRVRAYARTQAQEHAREGREGQREKRGRDGGGRTTQVVCARRSRSILLVVDACQHIMRDVRHNVIDADLSLQFQSLGEAASGLCWRKSTSIHTHRGSLSATPPPRASASPPSMRPAEPVIPLDGKHGVPPLLPRLLTLLAIAFQSKLVVVCHSHQRLNDKDYERAQTNRQQSRHRPHLQPATVGAHHALVSSSNSRHS